MKNTHLVTGRKHSNKNGSRSSSKRNSASIRNSLSFDDRGTQSSKDTLTKMAGFQESIDRSLSRLERGIRGEIFAFQKLCPKISDSYKRIELLEEEVEKRRISLKRAHAAFLLKQEELYGCKKESFPKMRQKK